MSSDAENEFFADGITEEIINALAKIGNLKVTSRTSSFFFKKKEIPVKEVAEQLGVGIILEGSVRVAGEKVRITAQLIQAIDDFHFWSETWDRKLENIFEIQDEISLLIADKLREHLGHFEIGDHLVNKQTDKIDAYTLSLKARYLFNKWNPTDVNKAIELFDQAIAIDPNHTESYLGLADAYSFLATTEFIPREEGWIKTMEYLQKANHLNPEHPGVHYQLANIAFFVNCDFKEAFMHGKKAIDLVPNYPEAQQYMAFLYMISDKMTEAQNHLQLALAIDPLNPETLFYKGYYFYRSGQYEEAQKVFQELLVQNPKNIPAAIVLAYSLLMQLKSDEVLDQMENVPDELLIPDEQLGILCLAYIQKGNQKKVDELVKKLSKAAEDKTAFQAHSYLFLAYANLNMFDKALEWLESAFNMKSSVLLLSFSDPLTGALKKDERYIKFHNGVYVFPSFESNTQKKSQLLDEKTAYAYQQKLQNYFDQEEPYLNPKLTLRDLSQQVEIHPNQLSWLLNEKFGKKFNEFVNLYRLDHFKNLIQNPGNENISIIGLAYESGFNSKTVFNTFFKKEEGITPNEYLKSLKNG